MLRGGLTWIKLALVYTSNPKTGEDFSYTITENGVLTVNEGVTGNIKIDETLVNVDDAKKS